MYFLSRKEKLYKIKEQNLDLLSRNIKVSVFGIDLSDEKWTLYGSIEDLRNILNINWFRFRISTLRLKHTFNNNNFYFTLKKYLYLYF